MKNYIEESIKIVNFTNVDFGNIRATYYDDEVWFVGKDIADALRYKDTKDALKKHVDNEDKITRFIEESGQRRSMTLINESGLYSLIFRSRLESAKKFKRWVTAEVLPTIRRYGMYFKTDNEVVKFIYDSLSCNIDFTIRNFAEYCELNLSDFTVNDLDNLRKLPGILIKNVDIPEDNKLVINTILENLMCNEINKYIQYKYEAPMILRLVFSYLKDMCDILSDKLKDYLTLKVKENQISFKNDDINVKFKVNSKKLLKIKINR